ncbi:MAG TPA: thioesterase domain-containing protein [Gemmatimonadaceae bacterium]|nr:thioesterase domain-containing protein [Gemmatimonadaceae bacterium]
MRLFCLPHAGGGASIYRPWIARLTAIDVQPIQLPGRETRVREPAFTRMDDLVGALADAIAPRLDAPYAIFGYSMGALIAFELTRELRRRRARSPLHLLVAARGAPRLASRRPPIHGLDDAAFVAELLTWNGVPAEIAADRDALAFFLPLLRADMTLCERYVYREEPPLDVPITAFGGATDPDATPEELAAWAHETTAGCALRTFPGGHFFIRDERDALLAAVEQALARPAG